ncbi:MAG: kelch repeat-containing protein, partial [Gaiellaceae bacterium]
MRRLAIAVLLVLAAGAVVAILLRPTSSQKRSGAPATSPSRPARTLPARRPRRKTGAQDPPAVLAERATGSLPAPLQDPSYVKSGRAVLLLGGLNAADTSVDTVISAGFHGARTIGRLPSVRHDTAAAALGGGVYVFGGGNGTAQLDEIVRVDPRSGRSTVVGRLPAASSDSTAATIGGTAYVVGGYTGTRWLDTIVAFRPGHPARVAARLPWMLRYAAVTAVGDRLVIAGGSRENGTASNAVLVYSPSTGRVTRLGTLPAATTHAAAAALGGVAYVVGGRGAAPGTPSTSIVAIDVGRRRVRPAGELAVPRSDLAAVGIGGRILVAAGSGTGGTVSTVSELAPGARSTTAVATANVYAHDGANRLAPAARSARDLVYVPNSRSDTVDVIDPDTYRVVEQFAVGGLPQHVVPAWDLKRLYVTNDSGNSLTTIDPITGKPGAVIPVDDPYNMYFTPDGRYAIVVAERLRRLDFRDAHTFGLHHSLPVPCAGVDHVDFSADGTYLIASCEFSGQLLKV